MERRARGVAPFTKIRCGNALVTVMATAAEIATAPSATTRIAMMMATAPSTTTKVAMMMVVVMAAVVLMMNFTTCTSRYSSLIDLALFQGMR